MTIIFMACPNSHDLRGHQFPFGYIESSRLASFTRSDMGGDDHGTVADTEYVIWELVNGLSMPADRPKAHSAVQEIQTAPEWEWVSASPSLFEAGMRLHRERGDKAWSLTDCISFLVMQQRRVGRALTYGHHFEQAGYEALLRRDPY